MKHQHRHGHWTRYGHGHGYMDIYNVQNIERNTGVVSVSDIDTDACRTPDTAKGWSVRAS